MIHTKKTFTYIVSSGCLFGIMFILLATVSNINVNWIKIFHSFGITFLLGGILLLLGMSFFNRLRVISLRAWRSCLFIYFLFIVLLLPKMMDALIVEKEGWVSLYKHPFVWLILASLIGNAVLYLFRVKDSTKVS